MMGQVRQPISTEQDPIETHTQHNKKNQRHHIKKKHPESKHLEGILPSDTAFKRTKKGHQPTRYLNQEEEKVIKTNS